MGSVLVGTAGVDITPPRGIELAGYAFSVRPVEEVHDPLSATVLAVRAGDRALALVGLDVVAVGSDFLAAVRRTLPYDVTVIACASHTHSGATLQRFPFDSRFYGIVDDAYLTSVAERIGTAIDEALARALPARIGVGCGRVTTVAANRRQSDGQIDPDLGVIRVEDVDGRLLVLLLNYACHPTVLHADNRAASADFPGAVRQRLRTSLGDVPILWTTGAAGDQSTRYTRRAATFDEVDRLGSVLAEEALRIIPAIQTHPLEFLAVRAGVAHLPARALPAVGDIQTALDRAMRDLRAVRGGPVSTERAAENQVFGYQQALTYARHGFPPAIKAKLWAVALNTIHLIGLPVEPFVEIGLAIKARCRQPCWVLGYTNEMIGYVPTAAAYADGGYEVGAAVVGPEAEEILVNESCALLATLEAQTP